MVCILCKINHRPSRHHRHHHRRPIYDACISCIFYDGICRDGHQLSLTEAKEICEKEITSNELEMYRDDGTIYRKRLGLSPDKLQIVKI